MKHLSWILTLPLLIIAVVFAVNHRGRITLDFWPLPLELTTPLFLLVLLTLFAGFLLGGLTVWLSQSRHRRRARERRYRVEELERETAFLKRRLEKAEAVTSAARRESREEPVRPELPPARTGT